MNILLALALWALGLVLLVVVAHEIIAAVPDEDSRRKATKAAKRFLLVVSAIGFYMIFSAYTPKNTLQRTTLPQPQLIEEVEIKPQDLVPPVDKRGVFDERIEEERP